MIKAIRVFYAETANGASSAIFIDNVLLPIVPATLYATASGTTVSINSLYLKETIVSSDYTEIADVDGNTFGTLDECMAYLAVQFSLVPASAASTSLFQEVLTIEELNVVPLLTKPWRQVLGAFANIIIGAAIMTNGEGVTFTDGSKVVAFDPFVAGFNLDPLDKIIAQYSS